MFAAYTDTCATKCLSSCKKGLGSPQDSGWVEGKRAAYSDPKFVWQILSALA